MKILMCCADWGVPLGGDGGSSVHFRSLAKALAGLGHDVRLLVSNRGGSAAVALPVEGVPSRRFWPGFSAWVERMRGRESGEPRFAPSPTPAPGMEHPGATAQPAGRGGRPAEGAESASWKVRLYYQDLPRVLDRVEEFLFHPRFFGRAVARAMKDFRPHCVYERYALGQTGAAWAVRTFGKGGVPHALEVNAPLAAERRAQGDLTGFWAWLGGVEEKRLWRGAGRVFCVSERLRGLAVEAGAEAGRVLVVPNGVDVESFTPERPKGALRNRLGAGPDEVLVGWLGSLSPGRGAEEFLRILALALPMADNARGVVIGGGRLDGRLRSLAAELGISGRVDFVGPVAHERVPDLLADLDVAVASYPGQEGFYFSPLKVAEYLACGLAVVAGRSVGGACPVEDGVNAVLLEPEDLDSWAVAVAGLCRNRDRRLALGSEARRAALRGPTWRGNALAVEREILACQRETIAGVRR